MEQETDLTPRSTAVKGFIQHINESIDFLRMDLHKNNMQVNSIRSELNTIDIRDTDQFNEITRITLDELERLEQTFRNFTSEDKKEFGSVKQNYSSIQQEKNKLAQSLMLLESRVQNMERSIGIELVLPSILK